MSRFFVFVLLAAVTLSGAVMSSPAPETAAAAAVTFSKDVLPVLQNNCQSCHRTGGVAPMSFQTYESTRPWAKAIKTAVLNKQMPPWFAEPQHGEFRNAPKLTDSDVATLARWADGGAREGNPAESPAPVEWTDGWRIQPDVVVAMAEPYMVQASGSGEIRHFVVNNPFKEDTWVSSIEIRPGDASVVHHVLLQVPTDQMRQFKLAPCSDCKPIALQAQPAVLTAKGEIRAAVPPVNTLALAANAVPFNGPFNPQAGGAYSDELVRIQERITGRGAFTTMEAIYAPGTQPLDFRFTDSAKLVRGVAPMRIEVHYTPNGKPTADQTRIGFTLAKAPASRRFVIMAPEHMVDARKPIPAGEANWETRGELTFERDAELVWFMPHMHLRGKDMTFTLVYPDAKEQTVLSAKFNFNWQLGYEVEKPIQVPKGTRMIVTAHHDNSANNPMNPTPGQAVSWGEMTSQEMMLPWFGVVVDSDAQPEMIATYRPGDFDGRMKPPQILRAPGRPQPGVIRVKE